ncbi:Lysophosphatidylcholine acyltransferase 1 [Galemys pyrenaicus]|uniref:Lysophosphatidylcholine acyltransferase 1 n=1 Tax=Galemys pyrenaicus TaxID=202257 RepID=A0A8J6A657_GALPY|nr:Lysophosphatidylcholine acyltransferase 1 [Galemys pyrenaicus]
MRLRGRGPQAAPAAGAGAGAAPRLAPPGRNPFVHELRLSALQKAQVALMTLTLFPVRLLLAICMMLLAWPLALVASLGAEDQEPEQPPALWRKVVDVLLRALMRTMWFVGGFHHVSVKGQQALPTEAAILTLAPHSSYFDAIPVTMTMSSIVMKAESRDIPVWGTLIKYIRPVLVSRSDQDSRRKTVEEIRRRALSKGRWPQIMIFPEGTCTNRTCLISFKPGAFIPGVAVQPVVLRYPNKLDTITWTWQGPGALAILWLTLCQPYSHVEIEVCMGHACRAGADQGRVSSGASGRGLLGRPCLVLAMQVSQLAFLPVYHPSEEEKRDPALFANNVRRVMAEALGVSVTDYTFEDCQLALAEGQLRLPADTCLLEFARLVRGLGLKPERLEKQLDEHCEHARQRGQARLSLEEFAAQLDLPICETLRELFSLFDEHGDGSVDLREYVIALSVVCRPSRTLDTIRLAFKARQLSVTMGNGRADTRSCMQMYGQQEDGSVDEDALSSILKTALGVAELPVTRLFRAIDEEEKGRITVDDFTRFAEMYPDFAEEYLHPTQKHFESGSQTPPPVPTPNGFCTDFSPESSDARRQPLNKKLD